MSAATMNSSWQRNEAPVRTTPREPIGPLPPIRQALPDFELRAPASTGSNTHSSTVSPTAGSWQGALLSPRDYVHSPTMDQRRRLSSEEGREERGGRDGQGSHVPRHYARPPTILFGNLELSTPFGDRERPSNPPRPHARGRSRDRSQNNSFSLRSIMNPLPTTTSTPVNPPDRLAPRPDLPSLGESSRRTFRPEPTPERPQLRVQSADAEYAEYRRYNWASPSAADQRLLQYRPSPQQHYDPQQPRAQSFPDYFPPMDRSSLDRPHYDRPASDYAYYDRPHYSRPASDHAYWGGPPYEHNLYQPRSRPVQYQPFDRTPFFSTQNHGPSYSEYGRASEPNSLGTNGDNRPRRRRGNLPKETTDRLRVWFQAHLSHPYPSEDEKQEMMRQTGLQMNQISNWFINARRRQLPELLARAASLRGENPDTVSAIRIRGSNANAPARHHPTPEQPEPQRHAPQQPPRGGGVPPGSYTSPNPRKRPSPSDEDEDEDEDAAGDDGRTAQYRAAAFRREGLRPRYRGGVRRTSGDDYRGLRTLRDAAVARGHI
ncbi:hypothetical protein BT67DRAFT_277481 [Trichocladium antarcticum]|uniref:Homeobox domain-containing protein n=1 Tax=Trichocladium antarcticum TaxID=1450529 RepID=A0AAN6UMI3_9PEZI|nr:hypothetical protein BT67DRAFT_277481 [Trichocladium antarcticum]